MRGFIERIFKARKEKQNVKQVETTQSEVIKPIEQVKEVITEIKKEEVVKPKKPNHFPDCTCFKCERWRN